MPRLDKLHPDPVLAADEVHWAPRQFILRTLARGGWHATSELLDAYNALAEEPATRDTFYAALSRLVRAERKVERIGTRNTGRYRLVRGLTLAAAIAHRPARKYRCAICGDFGSAKGHANGHPGRR